MANIATEHEMEALPELEGEFELEGEQFLGGIMQGLSGLLGESEYESESELGEFEMESELGEFESESEFEHEHELNPIRRVYPDALMEHMAHAAAEAENEHEAAEQFLPLIP